MPWLITMPAWPALAVHLADMMARATAVPTVATGATVGAVACAGAAVWRARARRRAAGPST